MELYSNLSNDKGVHLYSFGVHHINIKFANSNIIYKFSYLKPGKSQVERMKELAIRGQGLTTYINRYVRANYENKY